MSAKKKAATSAAFLLMTRPMDGSDFRERSRPFLPRLYVSHCARSLTTFPCKVYMQCMLYFLTKRIRTYAVVVLALVGCGPRSAPSLQVDRYQDATTCLSETISAYEGKTYAEMEKQVDGKQASRTFKMRGHAYEVLVTVSRDAENPPDRIQIDFDAFDGDEPPTMTPVNKKFYLRPGQAFQVGSNAPFTKM